MRRLALLTLGGAAGVVLVLHLLPETGGPGPRPAAPVPPPAAERARSSEVPSPPGTTQAVDAEAVHSVARDWVTAMWTRRPGEDPLAWLDRVADVTAPGLEAALRSARPWLADDEVLASVARVTGVHADAADPATVTVTCTVRLHTAAGERDEPCATTVSVARGADGRLVVAALR